MINKIYSENHDSQYHQTLKCLSCISKLINPQSKFMKIHSTEQVL